MEHNRSETKSTFNALKPCTDIAKVNKTAPGLKPRQI